jgi:hypothetical protein
VPTLEIVQALIVLLPGFVTTGIARALFVGEVENDFDKVVKSLIFSFVNYTIYAGVLWIWSLLSRTNTTSPTLLEMAPKTPGTLIVLSLIAVATGLVVAFYQTNNGHRTLYRFKITQRSTRQNVWHDFFLDHAKTYIIVNLEDGRRIYGWPYSYSDNPTEPSLFLTKAEWLSVDDEGQEKRISVADGGILLTSVLKIASIEVVGTQDEPESPNFPETLQGEENHEPS